MTSTEMLIEAVAYAEENGMEWWEIFDSPAEAFKIITKALKETPDEEQIICFLSAADIDDEFESHTIYLTYKNALKRMRHELQDLDI